MPLDITTTVTVYEFDELSDAAKERARDWYREDGLGYPWWDCTCEDAYTIAKLMGLDIEPQGKDDREHGISWTGFSSQGDGACFCGDYRPVQDAEAAVRGYAPDDKTLHEIAQRLDAVQKLGYGLRTSIDYTGRYSHSYSMSFDHTFETEEEFDQVAVENEVEAALRQFADWIYRTLEQEFDYLNSDEAVDGTIEANEYTFDVSGRRFG